MWILRLLACGDATVALDAQDAPTWYQDAAPIVEARCAGCHTSGGGAPFALDSYESAAPRVREMLAAIDAGTMPPWGAAETEECAPRFGWEEDARLTDAEKETLRLWADAGAPEGDPATAATLPAPPSVDLDEWQAELIPETGFAPSGDRDQFVCFVLDPGVTGPVWVTGIQVLPDDLAVDHHAVVFATTSVGDPDGDGVIPDCFNTGDGVPLGLWVPGSLPNLTPEGTGIPLARGEKILVQMHYHPAGAPHDPDRTGVRLRWQREAPEHEVVYTSIGNFASADEGLLPETDDRRNNTPEFRIPADAAHHTETMQLYLPDAGRYPLFAVEAHMHLVGTDLLATVHHEDPSVADGAADECLLHEPAWDFDWQRMYRYDAPLGAVSLGQGDTISVRCTYDNTLDNPGVVRALDDAGLDAPIDVYLGEETFDEMCLLIIGVTYDP